jgi:hypothetical protein
MSQKFNYLLKEVKFHIKQCDPEYLGKIIPAIVFIGVLVYWCGPLIVVALLYPIFLAFAISFVISLL